MLWDLTSGGLIKEWKSHDERVWAISMDDYHVTSAGLDRRVCVRSFLPGDLRFIRWQQQQQQAEQQLQQQQQVVQHQQMYGAATAGAEAAVEAAILEP